MFDSSCLLPSYHIIYRRGNLLLESSVPAGSRDDMTERNTHSSSQRLFKVCFLPDNTTVETPLGSTILDAAVRAGIKLYTACGGRGTCGKCAVMLLPDKRQVLACQYHVTGDITVEVPLSARQAKHRILQDGIEQDVVICPVVGKVFIRPPEGTSQALIQTLQLTGGQREYHFTDGALASLKQLSQSDLGRGVTAVCRLEAVTGLRERYAIAALESGDTSGTLYGVAVDIGTTTVVATLVDLNTGDVAATAASLNPQNVFGDDVISRISHGQEEAGLKELHDVTIGGLNELIVRLCADSGISERQIYEVSVVGNTTMNHIFLGYPIGQLGQMPYNAWSVDAHDVAPSATGLKVNSSGNIHTVENIAGFVGADTVGAAVAVRMDKVEKMTLVIDIGTNGELILGTKDRMFAASCAAGPAFEGARIGHGSRAMHGAIERVAFSSDSGDLEVVTIGGQAPTSICGSGLIDAVGVLLELGIVDTTGRFVSPEELKDSVSAKILARLTENNGQPAFVIAFGPDGSAEVILTQKDLREVQLAKAAIRAGIKLLQARAGVDDYQIEQYLVAGAFGNYIDPVHAMRIGLLPTVPLDRVKFVGNAAASGAKLVLLNRHMRVLAQALARRIKYVEIGHEAAFSTVFADCLFF
jgi:uncharacterized 2Fe-2S/4Fe-4S cluster protein (DUF4445 family)